MGMYTELILGAALKYDTPKEVLNTLFLLADHEDGNPNKPHEAGMLVGRNPLHGSSYYFAVSHPPKMWLDRIDRKWRISSRANIKNYEGEIDRLLAYIKPWIDQGTGGRDMWAMTCYEEADEPTFYYLYEADEEH